MKLRSRVTALTIAGLLVLAITGSLTASRFNDARSAAQSALTTLQPAADSAADLVLAISNMQLGVHTYVIDQRSVSLAPFAEGVTQSASDLSTLSGLLAEPAPDLSALVEQVQTTRDTWLQTAARPTIEAVRDEDVRRAVALVDSPASRASYALLQAEANSLQAQIDDQREIALRNLTEFADQLAVVLVASSVILVVGLLASVLLIGRWVIRPLNQLRRQLREVAREGQHDVPIAPSGPPELFAAGQDAEEMRRQLVTEIDEARMAREGLEQEGPVVTAIRSELRRPQVAMTGDLNVFGDLQPAQGVLAGDWWDVTQLPDGRTAIMVTDVSGHGPEAGIAGLRVKLVLTTLLSAGSSVPTAMARAASLFADIPSRFATCAVVVIDPVDQVVDWVNAGHLSPLIISARAEPRELGGTGPLLSALGGDWATETATFSDGDVLFMWTDGLSESRDDSGAELSEVGLPDILQHALASCGPDPAELVPTVLADARQRSVDWRRDDVTLIAARLT